MRKLNKLLALTLIIALSLTSVPVLTAQDYEHYDEMVFIQDFFEDETFVTAMEEHTIALFGYEFVQNHERALEAIYVLYSILPQDRLGQTMYPNSFGGIYINNEGNLVALTVENGDTSLFAPLTGMYGVLTREVEFSYNELWSTFEFLNEFDYNTRIENAFSWALCIAANRILVTLYDYSDEQITVFRRDVLDSPILVFSEAPEIIWESYQPIESTMFRIEATYEEIEPLSSTIIARFGDRLLTNVRPTPCSTGDFVTEASIGYRATRSTSSGLTRGFVTVAHVFPNDTSNQHVYVDQFGRRVLLGVTVVSNFHAVDAAFIGINDIRHSLFTGPNLWNIVGESVTLPDGLRVPIQSSHGNIIQGGTVHTIGSQSGLRTGTINNVALTLDLHPTRYAPRQQSVRLTIVDISYNRASIPGDSGAIVFSRTTTNPQIRMYGVVGIHVGAAGTRGYAMSATTINSRLGIRLD